MLRDLLSNLTGQQAPLAGARTAQVRNSAGGHVWSVDAWTRLSRFLVLGSDSGTYYAGPVAHALENLDAVDRCIALDGVRAVAEITAHSVDGRVPRNDQCIVALARCLKTGSAETRQAAVEAVPAVCRTGTHLFQLAAAVDAFGGWGRGTRRAFARWYAREDVQRLALQAVKYRQREGWSHRDLLRKTHLRPPSAEHDALFAWICRGAEALPKARPEGALALPWAVEKAQRVGRAEEIVDLIRAHELPREAVPTRFLGKPKVWKALLGLHEGGRPMPLTALVRNLGKLSSLGLFETCPEAVDAVCARLVDRQALRRARVHPLALLVALNTYRGGRGVRGSLHWRPHPRVLDALDQSFELAFECIEPTGKRWLLALDVSGSMAFRDIAGMTGVTPRVGAAAMAMATARTESRYSVLAFGHGLVPLDISARMRLDEVLERTSRLPFGATDCALPMIHARKRRQPVDVFVVYTDSETWFGKVHPARALQDYRAAMGIDARLIVVGMVANSFTIADPVDAGMLDVVGFDTAAPAVMADFARA